MAGLAQMSGWGFGGWDPIATNRLQQKEEDAANTAWERNELSRQTQYQTAVKDLQAAGLNPMLAAFHGGTPTVPAPKANMQTVGGSQNLSLQTAAQVENIQADTGVKEAEEAEIRARTPTHGVQIDKMKQEITESIERIQKIQQDVKVGVASAAQLQQQVDNMRAQLPQIQASTEQLKTLSKLQSNQAIEVLTRSGVNEQEAYEIWQRIQSNLPQIERAAHALELTIKEMSVPGHQANEAAQGSFLGQIGAYLKALLPLGGVMAALPVGRALKRGTSAEQGRQRYPQR